MSELPFAVRLAQAGLAADPQTARIAVVFGGSTYAIEAHETADGCLLRCDVESPGTSPAKYADALNQLGQGEPGTTELVVANNRLTVVRHLQETTSDDLRNAAQRLAGMTQLAEEIIAMLRTADAAEERLAKAPGGKFPNLQPALDALGPASAVGPTTVGALQGSAPVSPDGKWWWSGQQWVVMPPVQQASAPVSPDGKWWWSGQQWVVMPPVQQASAPVSPDGKRWWSGQQWVVMPPAPGAKKKGMGLGKQLLLALLVAVVVVMGLIFLVPKLGPNGHASAAKGLGPGPYYLHYDCGHNNDCISTMVNEATANGGNTGITDDYTTMATCVGVAPMFSGIVKTSWCSTSKNPADLGP